MSKHEVKTLDSVLVGPAMLILNQYFSTFLSEYLVLWLALVSFLLSASVTDWLLTTDCVCDCVQPADAALA